LINTKHPLLFALGSLARFGEGRWTGTDRQTAERVAAANRSAKIPPNKSRMVLKAFSALMSASFAGTLNWA
jgi:hypothetical protein